jgi:CheY-like chemotaxis protein
VFWNLLNNAIRFFEPGLSRHSIARPANQESRMGLGICKGIVGEHAGRIWGTSDGAGKGSTLTVELTTTAGPQNEAPAAGTAPDAANEAPADVEPVRVLVVEDDVDSSEMLEMFLSQFGYTVGTAPSLAAGIARLGERWDVVLSDLGLPDGSGLEIARRARLLPHPPQRLIALTGYGSGDDIRATREAGFDDHVVKPIDLDRLLLTLGGIAAQRQA